MPEKLKATDNAAASIASHAQTWVEMGARSKLALNDLARTAAKRALSAEETTTLQYCLNVLSKPIDHFNNLVQLIASRDSLFEKSKHRDAHALEHAKAKEKLVSFDAESLRIEKERKETRLKLQGFVADLHGQMDAADRAHWKLVELESENRELFGAVLPDDLTRFNVSSKNFPCEFPAGHDAKTLYVSDEIARVENNLRRLVMKCALMLEKNGATKDFNEWYRINGSTALRKGWHKVKSIFLNDPMPEPRQINFHNVFVFYPRLRALYEDQTLRAEFLQADENRALDVDFVAKRLAMPEFISEGVDRRAESEDGPRRPSVRPKPVTA